jgi:hypothetical protein
MIIYLAAGFSIINVKGRERELMQRYDRWHRLISFHFEKERDIVMDEIRKERRENEKR